jgi:hypothetical protein
MHGLSEKLLTAKDAKRAKEACCTLNVELESNDVVLLCDLSVLCGKRLLRERLLRV